MKKIILVFTISLFLFLVGCSSDNPESLNAFAKCLTENGVDLYGSVTCPHCTTQKEMFGDALKFIDYTECTENQQKCAEEEIQYLPTWKFNDGTSVSGVKSFDYLAEKTDCVLS